MFGLVEPKPAWCAGRPRTRILGLESATGRDAEQIYAAMSVVWALVIQAIAMWTASWRFSTLSPSRVTSS